jgi:hypothetical protein
MIMAVIFLKFVVLKKAPPGEWRGLSIKQASREDIKTLLVVLFVGASVSDSNSTRLKS